MLLTIDSMHPLTSAEMHRGIVTTRMKEIHIESAELSLSGRMGAPEIMAAVSLSVMSGWRILTEVTSAVANKAFRRLWTTIEICSI
jgi:hypothetical protein